MASAVDRLCSFINRRSTYFESRETFPGEQGFRLALCTLRIAVLVFATGFSAAAPQPITLTHVGEWPGFKRTSKDDPNNMMGLVVSGRHAYVESWDGLGIVDFTSPEKPVGFGFGDYGELGGRQLAVRGKLLYQPFYSGFRILDITDAGKPIVVGWPSMGVRGIALYLSGNYAYLTGSISTETNGFYVLDITNPTNAVVAGELVGRGGGSRLVVAGDYAYVTPNTGSLDDVDVVRGDVEIIDVSARSRPVFVGTVPTATPARDIVIEGKRMYAAGETLEIFDISQPSAPSALGKIDLPTRVVDIEVLDGRIYAAAEYAGVHVFDVRDASSPIHLGTFEIVGRASGLFVQEDYVYVAAGLGGVALLDYRDVIKPRLVGAYHCNGYGERIEIVGSTAFLVDSLPELRAFDITNPGSPVHLDTYGAQSRARGLTVAGEDAYLLSANSWDEISRVDISNPADLKNRKRWHSRLYGEVIIPSGDYLYAAWSGGSCFGHPPSCTFSGGIDVFDAQDLGLRLGRYSFEARQPTYAAYVQDMVIVGEHAFVQHLTKFVVVQLRGSQDPVAIGEVSIRGGRIAVSRDYAYVGGVFFVGLQQNGIWVVSIQDRSRPVNMGAVRTEFPVEGMTINGKHLFVSSRNLVQVFDLSDPSNPVAVGHAVTKGDGKDIAVAGDYVYVADGDWGLQVFQVEFLRLSAEVAGGELRLSWPGSASDHLLERSGRVIGEEWQAVEAVAVLEDGVHRASVPVEHAAGFFRLRRR